MKSICSKCWLTMYPHEVRHYDNQIVCEDCYWILVRRESETKDLGGEDESRRKD